ncbi:hypothetical protein AI27_02705 [Sphingomonas sp. BHC-A]|uniref:TonB-dependent receptor n=1 Tax=Sphingobium indicum TaxID=332055 RepID=UPI00052DC958|nr:TonB-dependent receptor [Sphingobium indicum]KEY99581.1 hypothetical protein AI27_02705 [Sphingomonas sp. BHC-A]NYI24104.1 outer membrane receptor protein involved in Fe transport [Sphingobium indicum]
MSTSSLVPLAATGSLALVTAAQAQGAPAQGAPAQAAAQPTASDIVVTGTRISGFTAPTPVTAISQAQLQEKAVHTVSELLQDIPQLRINQNVGKSSEPVGASTADLRGLGPQRTLVLLDGRRLPLTDPAGTIDTNVIPTALISNVEIVTGGASAAYGSDAVAGVVNFTLERNLEGFRGDLSYAQTKYDDFHRPAVSLAYGHGFMDDRLHVEAAFDYLRNSGQTSQASRPWGSHRTALLTNPNYTATNGQPRLIIADNSTFSQMTPGGVLGRTSGLALARLLGFPTGTGVQFGPNGQPVPFNYGTNVGGTYMTGGDGGSFEDGGNLLPILKRYTGYGRIDFDLTQDIKLFGDYLQSRTETRSDLTANYDNGTLTINADNAYLPAALRSAMAAANMRSFALGRQQLEDGTAFFSTRTTMRRGVIGVEGKVGGWSWDVSGQIGSTHYRQDSTNNRIQTRFFNAVDAVINPATGQPVCRVTLQNPGSSNPDISGCVPVNLFGAGAINQAAQAYYLGNSWQSSVQREKVFYLNLKGSPFTTWAGDVSLAAGAEYRTEQTVLTSDPDSAAARWRSINAQPFSGKYNVKEVYGEVVVPLARDMAFAKNLELNGAVRYTDYSTSGGVATWKVGLNYAPVSDIRFRGTISRDIRAPNNYELFSRGNQVISQLVDRPSNVSGQVLQVTSGNPDLKPEKADTRAIGAVFQPGWLPGFRMSVDYYSIKIKDAISTVSGQNIVDFCFNGQTVYCASVVRDASGRLTRVNVVPFNAQSQKTSGIDFEAMYRFPLRTFGEGTMTFRVLANYVAELKTIANGVTNDYVGLAGVSPPPLGVPQWRFNAEARYQIGRAKLGVTYSFIDGGKYDTRFNVTTLDLDNNNIPSRGYVDLDASYKLTENFDIYGRIDNLFNVAPPIAPNAIVQPQIANSPFYDTRGMFWTLGVRARF